MHTAKPVTTNDRGTQKVFFRQHISRKTIVIIHLLKKANLLWIELEYHYYIILVMKISRVELY